MRTDFKFKKEVEQFSKVDSVERIKRIEGFVQKFKTHPDCERELGKWQIQFASQAVGITARVLPPDSLQFGGVKIYKSKKNI